MSLYSIGQSQPSAWPLDAEPIVDLERRLPANATERRPDPDFERFYEALAAAEGDILPFVTAYRNALGERPYASSGEQMKVLLAALERLKDGGLGKSELYEGTYKGFTTVFGVKGFVEQFKQEVFDVQALAQRDDESGW